MRRILGVLVALLALALLGGLAGVRHPVGDSLAVFRLPLLLVFALVVIWTGWPRLIRWPLVAGALAAAVAILPLPEAEPVGAGGVTVFQQNLKFDRVEDEAFLDLIRQTLPDVLLLQEVSPRNRALLDALLPLYPEQRYCPVEQVGEAVLSRLPVLTGGFCSLRDGLAGLRVQTLTGPVWMVSLHISWPWPHPQAEQVSEILPELEDLDGPVVIAGDFNAVAWSHTLERVAQATGTERLGQHGFSFTLPGIGLPIGIDHLLAPEGTRFERVVTPPLGSDHKGQWLRLWLPSAGQTG